MSQTKTAKTAQKAKDLRLEKEGKLLDVDDDSKEHTEKHGWDLGSRPPMPPIKVVDEAGVVKEIAMDLGQNLVPCCGAPPPAGSWYGPFGFFRMMGGVFMLLALFAIFATIHSATQKDWVGVLMNIVLIVAAFISAISAYCHEGLSNEVGVFARQNDEFANENGNMSEQLNDLDRVAKQYERVLEELQGDEKQLDELVEALHRIVLMKSLGTIFNSYMDADINRDEDLKAAEVDTFFSNIWEVLKFVSGDFPLDMLYQEAVAADAISIDKNDVKHLIYACSCYGDPKKPGATRAFLWLVLFSFDPDLYADQTATHLITAILGSDASDAEMEVIRDQVNTIADAYDDAFKLTHDTTGYCKEFVKSILHGHDNSAGSPPE